MGLFDFARSRNDHRAAEAIIGPSGDVPVSQGQDPKTRTDLSGSDTDDSLSLEERNEKEIQLHPNTITTFAQPGVQKAEAVALVWSRPALYTAYAWIWFCFFMLALQSAIGNNVLYYAYSDFATAPAVATAQILASIIGGVIKLPIAKVLNIWGRAEGFLLFVGVYLLGIIIIASCTGPSGYAAGYVLYWIGYDAIYLILDVFVADTTGLRNRPWAFGFVSTPFICTAFTGPLAAQAFLDHSTWRWAYGAFAIIMPCVFVPLAIAFKYYQRKAVKMGLFNHVASGRTTMQSIVHYTHEFDVVGALILMGAFILFLLPFSLVSYNRLDGYHSAGFIVMVIIGILLFPVFALWEKYFARVHFVRWELFRQRTVLGACCLAAILYFNFYAWDNTYYNFVLVVYNLNVSMTGYMTQIYNVGSCFWGVVIGFWMRFTKEFKWTALCFGLPLMFLGSGLMIHFRGGEGTIGYIIMCQIFIAFSGGTLVISEDMAVMAAADRDGVPMMLSLIGLSSSIGGAIGSSVAQSIYFNTFTEALTERLPGPEKVNASTIYLGGYLAQLKFEVGTPERDAINYAYGQVQRNGCIAGTCILVLAIPAIAVWKNYRLNKQQNKGLVI